MSKKLIIFPEIQKRPPTKRELIAASQYARNPERIEALAKKLAFVREVDVYKTDADQGKETLTPEQMFRLSFIREDAGAVTGRSP